MTDINRRFDVEVARMRGERRAERERESDAIRKELRREIREAEARGERADPLLRAAVLGDSGSREERYTPSTLQVASGGNDDAPAA